MSETTETGPVLGEEARIDELISEIQRVNWSAASAVWVSDQVPVLVAEIQRLRALVAEAERRGEARGAQAERERLADLFLAHRETLTTFAGGKDEMLGLLAHLLRLGSGRAS